MGHHDWNAAVDCGGFTAVGGVDFLDNLLSNRVGRGIECFARKIPIVGADGRPLRVELANSLEAFDDGTAFAVQFR